MSDSDPPYVFAAVDVSGVEMIDGGRTLAIRLRKADGDEAAVRLSRPVADDLSCRITALLDARSQRRFEPNASEPHRDRCHRAVDPVTQDRRDVREGSRDVHAAVGA
jgi:hypothetical protein